MGTDDLYAMFEETISDSDSVEDAGELSRNANVYLGDDDIEVSDADEVSDVDSEIDSIEDTDVEDLAESDDDDAPADVFDFDSIKDKTISVTVQGETFEVPLSELRNGYMRQADYTRKTQQIAADAKVVQWAHDLQEAFKNDPQGSIRFLQQQFGVLDSDVDDPYEYLDPEFKPIVNELQQTKQQLAELQRQQQLVDQQRAVAEAQSELERMKARYSDFDPMQVLPIAIDNGLPMDMAYKLWKADQLESQTAAEAAAKAKAEKAAASRDKARQVSKTVAKGSNKAASADDSWKQFGSFEEIFAYEVNRSR